MRMHLFILQNDRTGYVTALMDWTRSWESSRCQVRIARYNGPSPMVLQAHAIADMLWYTNNFEAAKQFVDGCKLLLSKYEGKHSGNIEYFWFHLRKPLRETRAREAGSTPLSIETLRSPSKHTPDFVIARDADVDRMMDQLMEKGNILQNLEKMQNIMGDFCIGLAPSVIPGSARRFLAIWMRRWMVVSICTRLDWSCYKACKSW